MNPITFTPVLTFTVPGLPRPGGSKTAKVIQRNGEVVRVNGRPLVSMRDDAQGNKEWRADVKFHARKAWDAAPLSCTLRVTMKFTMPRLKGHFGSGKNAGVLKASAPVYHTVKPDLVKLTRSTEDACTGVLWADDAQIAEHRLSKVYGERPGVEITLEVLDVAETTQAPAAPAALFAEGAVR